MNDNTTPTKERALPGRVSLVVCTVALLVNIACGPAANPRPPLPERGSTYTVLHDTSGLRFQSEIEEVEKAARYDAVHLVEMERAHRLIGVYKGDLVLVIDLDIGVLRGSSWAQVRILQGRAQGTVWIRFDAIQGVNK